jgi:hypothetical protein
LIHRCEPGLRGRFDLAGTLALPTRRAKVLGIDIAPQIFSEKIVTPENGSLLHVTRDMKRGREAGR